MSQHDFTICVVEDDLDVCDSLEALVSALGHRCHTFDSAEALLLHWNLCGCQLLIIDVDLPEMSGLDLLTMLRDRGDQTPAVIYTGRTDSRIRAAAAQISHAQLIVKGDDTSWIEQTVMQLAALDTAGS